MNKNKEQEKSFLNKITSIFSRKKEDQNTSVDSLKDYASSNQVMSEKNVAEIKNGIAQALRDLSPSPPKAVPSYITNEEIQLTDRQKDILLKDGSIGIPFKDNSEDYAEWKLYLDKDKDKDISVFYYTGEEFLMKRSDLYETKINEWSVDTNPYSIAIDGKSPQYSNCTPKYAAVHLLELEGTKNVDFIDNRTGVKIRVDNPAINQKIISDLWAKELTVRTDLSSGLTLNQIDEKQAYHYRNYEKNPVFVVENLNITNEQRKTASKNEELGMNEDYVLTKEQSAKIPDEIGHLKLSPMDKQNLAMGGITIERLGESYQIEDNKILKTYLNHNEDLTESRVFIHQNEVKFNNSNILSESQAKNVAYLSTQMKYLGFKETPELKAELTSKVISKADNFVITQNTDKNFFRHNEISFDLKFNKSKESDKYFLNSYDIKLKNAENGKNLTHNVDLRKIPFTHKEAVNLIEGRSVKTDLTLKNQNKETVFLNIDFNKQLENKKGFELNKFFPNYGTKTDEILTKSKVFIADDKEELKDRIIKSLEKGNVVPVLIKEKEGETKSYNAVLNPEYKTLNLYDSKMQRVKINESLANGVKVEKNTSTTVSQQNTNNRKM